MEVDIFVTQLRKKKGVRKVGKKGEKCKEGKGGLGKGGGRTRKTLDPGTLIHIRRREIMSVRFRHNFRVGRRVGEGKPTSPYFMRLTGYFIIFIHKVFRVAYMVHYFKPLAVCLVD